MKKRSFRYEEGGDVDALEEANKGENLDTTPGPKAEPEPEKPKTFKQAFAEAKAAGDKTFTFGGKKYTTETAGAKSSAPVAGRPRGESVGEPKRAAPMFASDADFDRNVAAAAVRNREAAAERERESRRRAVPEGTTPKAKRLSTAGMNPKTLLPSQSYAKGGSVKGSGCEQRGLRKCKVY